MANSHKRRNNIDIICIRRKWLNGVEEVKTSIVNVFKNIMSDPGDWRASPKGLNFSRVDDFEAASLEVLFE